MTAPADKGRANEAIIQGIADALVLRAAQIKLVRGPTSRRKLFAVEDPPANLAEKLVKLMSGN